MRAKVVVVGNEKGGAGKTTVATNLAAIAACNGKEVMLIDADPGQASSALWAGRRSQDHPTLPPVTCVEIRQANQVKAGILSFSSRYDLIVVDTGAVDSPHLRAGAVAGDVLVVPVQSDALDLWALPTIARIYGQSLTMNPRLTARIVLNRLLHHTAAHKPDELREWMRTETPELPSDAITHLIARAAYGKASSDGLAVTELAGRAHDPKATAEMSAVYKEIVG